jgi:hypothetical protein
MELMIPIIALGGLYMASKSSSSNTGNNDNTTPQKEGFESLPNTDIPNRNYPSEYPISSAEVDQTSKLSTINTYDTPSVYTDKYFNGDVYPKSAARNSFTSMTGQKVDSNYFQHNNMTPFFGAKNRSTILASNSTESVLDNYVGSGTQAISKSEQSPLFTPGENYHYPHGAPNKNDFYQSRVNPSLRMANTKPFESIQVGPGLGQGASSEGSGGYNSGMAARDEWMPKDVNELRTTNNPRAGGVAMFGHEGPANSAIKNLGGIGQVEKNRVERAWEVGPDRYFTTTGVEKGQTMHAIPIDRHTNRPETSVSYTGGAGTHLPETYQSGEYLESKHMDLGAFPLGIATLTGKHGGLEEDYESKSKKAYPNNRGVEETYFGAFSGAIGAVIAPLLDELRPSRKANVIGSLRPYQNAHTAISSSYLFNPADKPDPNNRETTDANKFIPGVNSNQRGGAYETTSHQASAQQRDSTSTYYAGGSSAAEGTRGIRPYDAEYRQRNNDLKSSTIQGQMVQGNMNSPNAEINMRNREGEIKNSRPLMHTAAPKQIVDTPMNGAQHSRQEYVQQDRNAPDMVSAFKENPFTHDIKYFKGPV